MPYIKNTIYAGEIIEVEKVHSGRWGKRIKISPKNKPTPEDMKKINERNVIKKLRRKLLCNFEQGDYHIVLSYPKNNRPTPAEAAKKLGNVLKVARRWYKKQNKELKYIHVTEYKKTAIHHHVIINNAEGCMQKIREAWKGGMYPSVMYTEGNFGDLAAYLVKETKLSRKDIENPNKLHYSCSRNLKEPRIETKVISANDWREHPEPKAGYWIPKGSVVNGISEVTGRRYQYYTMAPVEKLTKEEKQEEDKYYKPRRAPCRSIRKPKA